MPKWTILRNCLAGLMVIAAGFAVEGAVASGPTEQDAPIHTRLAVDWRNPGQTFEGWGTALAWFAHVTGRYPDREREALADLLYAKSGLELNIARYNIGGGNAPDVAPYLRPGADVPGFWRRPPGATGMDWWKPDDPAMWDWSADAGQRWWLDAIRNRVPRKDLILEAFSNSPPWFMTVSGKVSGNTDGLQDNLRPDKEALFAEYLAGAVQGLEQRHGIHFRTLSPINEPNTPYWFAANTQEGAHWSVQAQSRMYLSLAQVLRARGMATQISGPDETNALTFFRDWEGLSAEAKAAIDQINVHSYESLGKSGVRDIAMRSGKRFWMSEVDLSPATVREDFNDMRPALALAEQIIDDINTLRPQAWVLWQAVENQSPSVEHSSNWGLIKSNYVNPRDPYYHLTKKYWAFAQFTKFIRPGSRFLPTSDRDTLLAYTPGDGAMTIVNVNPGLVGRIVDLPAPKAMLGRGCTIQTYVTDGGRNLAKGTVGQCKLIVQIRVGAQSITTTVLSKGDSLADRRKGPGAVLSTGKR